MEAGRKLSWIVPEEPGGMVDSHCHCEPMHQGVERHQNEQYLGVLIEVS